MTTTTKATPEPMNFDPNLIMCGRMVDKTVRLTFGRWHYRTTIEIVIGGNTNGLSVIESAVESAYYRLDTIPFFNDETGENEEMAVIDFGDLECHDDGFRGGEWLKDMLISAEIIKIEPEAKQ